MENSIYSGLNARPESISDRFFISEQTEAGECLSLNNSLRTSLLTRRKLSDAAELITWLCVNLILISSGWLCVSFQRSYACGTIDISFPK